MPAATFAYKGRSEDIRKIAKELGVRYVLEGSVRRSANRVRITGQLIEGGSGNHVWAEKFEGSFEDIFYLQDRLTESIVGALEPTLRRAELERARSKRPEMLDAYDFYLRTPYLSAGSISKMRPAEQLTCRIGVKASVLLASQWCGRAGHLGVKPRDAKGGRYTPSRLQLRIGV